MDVKNIEIGTPIEFLKYVNSCKSVDIEYQRLEDFKKKLAEEYNWNKNAEVTIGVYGK